jgi:hypothetical protein
MKTLKVLLSAGLLCGGMTARSLAQDQNQDVKATITSPAEGTQDGEKLTEVVVTVTDDAEKTANDSETTDEEITKDDSKVSVSGKKGVYSIQVQSTTGSDSDEDGENKKVKTSGKVIVVGPDGERKVYEINGKEGQALKIELDGDGDEALKHLHDVLIMKAHGDKSGAGGDGEEVAAVEEERYMIGVQCEEAGDVLRRHLHLGSAGLVVMEVREGTPAEQAGLMKDDIITQIDGKDLATRDDLVSAVVASEGKSLSLSILRDGEKQSVAVEPKKMKVPVIMTPAEFDFEMHEGDVLGRLKLEGLPEDVRKQLQERRGSVKLRRVHPGVMIDEELPHDKEAINKLIERIRKSAGEEAAKAVAEAKESAHDAHSQALRARKALIDAHKSDGESIDETLHGLQKQMEAIREQMESLQKQLAAEKKSDKQ